MKKNLKQKQAHELHELPQIKLAAKIREVGANPRVRPFFSLGEEIDEA